MGIIRDEINRWDFSSDERRSEEMIPDPEG